MRFLSVAALASLLLAASAQPATYFEWLECMSKDYETSVRVCTVIIETEKEKSSVARAHYYRGEASRVAGENDDAIADYVAAIELWPAYPAAFRKLAIVQMRIGDFEEAIANARTAFEMQPTDTARSILKSLGAIPGRPPDYPKTRTSD